MSAALCFIKVQEVDKSQISELARFLEGEQKRRVYRDLEAMTGVPRPTLSKIINNQLKGLPELETLAKVATAFNMPLWRVVEMAGIDAGIAQTPSAQGKRLAALVEAHPDVMSDIVDGLLDLDPSDLRGVLAYVELVLRQKGGNR